MAYSKKYHSLICDYLDALGVPHTDCYSNKQVESMPFKTMFGFTKLLESYGLKSEGYLLEDKTEISKITPPFIARTPKGYVIVTGQDDNSVCYLTEGIPETIPKAEFFNAWDGNVILSYPDEKSCEPEYGLHSRIEFAMKAKKWVLWICTIALFAYFFITRGLYSNISTILIAAIDLAGLYFTYLLVQKSANIHNAAADKVCGVLQEGGCDDILKTSAAKFFGLFGWSEVGFAYFSVSLLSMLFFPSTLPWLALCNLCCLPFTFWSIWYQKFRAHSWCTLCVSVQASLWLLFLCYLFGGWLRQAWPLKLPFFVLGVAYVTVLLGLNAIMPLITKEAKD